MAKTIADFEPEVMILGALDNLFSGAIETRSNCTRWYEEHIHRGEGGSNRQHAHFTDMPTPAWETLGPFREVRTSRVRSPAPGALEARKPLVELVNRFSGLDVEHSSEQDPEHERTGAAKQDENDYKLTDVTYALHYPPLRSLLDLWAV